MTTVNCTTAKRNNLLRGRLLCGVGYNSGGLHQVRANGVDVLSYIAWSNMIKRCYKKERRARDKSYEGCTVSVEFHNYQEFAEWYTNHEFYGLGYCIDKDILNENCKIYSPDTCCLVPTEINNLFVDRRGDRGSLPIGVNHHPKTGKFMARVSTNKGRTYLGLYKTPQEAHQAYVIAKEAYVKEVANKWRGRIDERVYEALMAWKSES